MSAETEPVKGVEFNPSAAFQALQRAEKSQLQSEQLRKSCERMAGTSTVQDCVVKVYQDGKPTQLSVVEYVDWLANEAANARHSFVQFGGEAAVGKYYETLSQLEKTHD